MLNRAWQHLNSTVLNFVTFKVLRLHDTDYQKRVDDYNKLMVNNIKEKWPLWLAVMMLPITFAKFFFIGINISESLPDHVFITKKGDTSLVKNHYVQFAWHGGGPYEAGVGFVKIIKGVPGDTVTMDEKRNFFVNGEYVGTAKSKSKSGEELKAGFTGVIPPHHFYAFAPNKDSLDSRYALTGLISDKEIIGRAYPIF